MVPTEGYINDSGTNLCDNWAKNGRDPKTPTWHQMASKWHQNPCMAGRILRKIRPAMHRVSPILTPFGELRALPVMSPTASSIFVPVPPPTSWFCENQEVGLRPPGFAKTRRSAAGGGFPLPHRACWLQESTKPVPGGSI